MARRHRDSTDGMKAANAHEGKSTNAIVDAVDDFRQDGSNAVHGSPRGAVHGVGWVHRVQARHVEVYLAATHHDRVSRSSGKDYHDPMKLLREGGLSFARVCTRLAANSEI